MLASIDDHTFHALHSGLVLTISSPFFRRLEFAGTSNVFLIISLRINTQLCTLCILIYSSVYKSSYSVHYFSVLGKASIISCTASVMLPSLPILICATSSYNGYRSSYTLNIYSILSLQVGEFQDPNHLEYDLHRD